MNDKHEYLIALLNGVKNGYNLPETITKDDYYYVKSHKDEDKVLTGFVGFACSFGGKWFAGYAKNNFNVNYALRGKKSLLKDMATLMTAEIICKDYREVELPDGCIVLADPPYVNTTKYSLGDFDTNTFWEYMRIISKNHLTFVCEQTAPDDFVSIWSKPIRRSLDVNKDNQFQITENLFVHKSIYEKLKR